MPTKMHIILNAYYVCLRARLRTCARASVCVCGCGCACALFGRFVDAVVDAPTCLASAA